MNENMTIEELTATSEQLFTTQDYEFRERVQMTISAFQTQLRQGVTFTNEFAEAIAFAICRRMDAHLHEKLTFQSYMIHCLTTRLK